MTRRDTRRWGSRVVAVLLAAAAWCAPRPVHADYQVYAVTDGCTADKINPGDTVQVQLWLVSDNLDVSNSVIVQLAFSSPGLVYNSLTWHGVYASSTFDNSTPRVFPTVVNSSVLLGGGHPAGVVDIELSNVAVSPFCVTPGNASTGACQCPGGQCIGDQCIGGDNGGFPCTTDCAAGSSCTNRFADGLLATLSFTVPMNFSGMDAVVIQPIVDEIADGFAEVHSSAPEELALYLACVVAGDANCDARVTLADFGTWAGCVTGPGGTASPVCMPFDFNDDGDVDLLDWSALQLDFQPICVP
ncbi:MAG: hypothetical protein HOP29_10540 [Phycisphaerales bacterium]|nr:hypothetical protein [Phycisphaerales bacterium]